MMGTNRRWTMNLDGRQLNGKLRRWRAGKGLFANGVENDKKRHIMGVLGPPCFQGQFLLNALSSCVFLYF